MGNLLKALSIARKALGKLTDFLVAGRAKGLWKRKQGPTDPPKNFN